MRALCRALALAWLGGSTMLTEGPMRLETAIEERAAALKPDASEVPQAPVGGEPIEDAS